METRRKNTVRLNGYKLLRGDLLNRAVNKLVAAAEQAQRNGSGK